jgi:hypothetical protein
MVTAQAVPTLIYLHIPKCAGSSMMDVLQRNYGAGFYRVPNGGGWRRFHKLPEGKRECITCLTGHIPWGLGRYVPGPHRYAVMLRDPVERVASLYWFCRQFKKHKWHKLAMRSTLEQFATSRAFADLDNGITRWLAARADVGRLHIKQGLTSEDERLAMLHLQAASVGFVESFGHSVHNWSLEFGWEHTAFGYKQAIQHRGPTREERRLIAEYNRFDVALYEWARAQCA